MINRLLPALAAALVAAATAQAAPLEAYGKLPNIEQAAVSPSGKLVAYIATDGEKRMLAVQSTADRKFLSIDDVGTAKLRDLTWAGDDHLILTVSTAERAYNVISARMERQMAFDFNFMTRRVRPLLNDVTDAMNTVTSSPQIRMLGGKPFVFFRGGHVVGDFIEPCLFRIDLDSGKALLVDGGGNDVDDWVIDADGRIVASEAYDDRRGIWTLRLRTKSGGWRRVDRVSAPVGAPETVGLSQDGKAVVISVGDEATGNGWQEVAIDSGAWSDQVANAAGEEAVVDPTSGRVIAKHALVGDDERYTFFDAHDAAIWQGIRKAYPGDLVTLQSWSADHRKIVVRADSPTEGPAYAFVDLDTGQADWLGAEYVGLKPEDISPRTPVRYKAADGLEITGYLTLPHGRDPQGLPLVVLAHGGPADRDDPGFDWWAEALASRGYAVLQPNFRGSGGLGWSFLSAGFGQWGRKMQTDLSDGVRHLAQQGVINPKRVCVVGASYGGYAALAGATLDHGVYRCAVSVAGVSDLHDLVQDFRARQGDEAQRYWFRFIGTQSLSDPVMDAYSPTAHAADADAPILLIHGRDDTVVPIAHSRKMADALRRAGKPVELVELPGEDHWLSRGATRLQMLQATVAFLEKNNPPN